VPFGVVGGRLYHVMTDWKPYFGEDGSPWAALYVWRGGLGVWGAIALGAVGALIGARRQGIRFPPLLDALAPGVLVAQAIGRFGNWFNQELFGRPTSLPWGLEISPDKRPAGYANDVTFHPTFLYESIYCLLGGIALLWIDKRLRLKRGQLTALYVIIYTFGRFFFENLRIDDAHDILGLRVNAWVSLGLFCFGVLWFLWLGRHGEEADAPLVREPEPIP
jgi:prolipoprotein diacylglyceryl transferase